MQISHYLHRIEEKHVQTQTHYRFSNY